MSHRYAPLPNPRSDSRTQLDQEQEMAEAFDYSDNEDDERSTSETQPLNTQSSNIHDRGLSLTRPPQFQSSTTSSTPPTYDFENDTYDYPPPGSPPPPSSTAFPNNIGNSNGLVPTFESVQAPRGNWFKRTAATLLPSSVAARVGMGQQIPSGPVGGGSSNDGVFANVTAKPTAPTRIGDGDDAHLVPEETVGDAPPSYAAAQADAVPPYWETTVHAPFSPDSAGEMIIDSLPTGSVFSFLWNMLVSVSFQFVGFLLTYLLHTTHSARLGSRAGLGITLIQYGFALRGNVEGEGGDWKTWHDTPPTFSSGAEANAFYNEAINATSSYGAGLMPDDKAADFTDVTTEWLSFFLMTVGWFILLTSLLGFWRVKRWERGILASQRESPVAAQPSVSRPFWVERMFGIRRQSQGESPGDLFWRGFGFGRQHNEEDEEETRAVARAEEGEAQGLTEHSMVLTLDPNDSGRNQAIIEAVAQDRLLETRLREANFL
ncbi:hypothetical protein AGABI1DRAFT_113368 [Agaricus bisporus var. burnettii JB137-S8]|uniref:Metal homeostatis protein bsd2 n=1 Tax=Agaricus bisporus var. burnettii (strain JB137-S8 / ATCC MYA-4627 / FGSC 10392) TaxID=597362 RepID=K5XXY0_AGABU|nr:uncharacterized protein AGABI1DRAFT_113368 [Agaricus bisporus var. burnettii JB137-S8]EKM80160.1 hypothetical protein AGABI1DRAFT_113368 [Agaricus bisporus var. burnettii JB137-S8]